MDLKEKIEQTYLKYFKERNVLKEAYSEIKTQILLKEKELKRVLEESEIKSVIESYIKKLQKSIAEFEAKWIVSEMKNKLVNEVKELSQYIDKEMGEKELKEKTKELYEKWVNNLGLFMKEIKTFWKINMQKAKEFFEELNKNEKK